jgi:hypothetical protein
MEVWSQHLVLLEPSCGRWWLVCQQAGGVEARQAGRWVVVACGWWPTCSFSVSWHGEHFHGLGVQCAEVSALPGALPQPRMSPASRQGRWFPELMQSVSVSGVYFLNYYNDFFSAALLAQCYQAMNMFFRWVGLLLCVLVGVIPIQEVRLLDPHSESLDT